MKSMTEAERVYRIAVRGEQGMRFLDVTFRHNFRFVIRPMLYRLGYVAIPKVNGDDLEKVFPKEKFRR